MKHTVAASRVREDGSRTLYFRDIRLKRHADGKWAVGAPDGVEKALSSRECAKFEKLYAEAKPYFRERIGPFTYKGATYVGHSNDSGTYDFWNQADWKPVPPEIGRHFNRHVLNEEKANSQKRKAKLKRNKHGLQCHSIDGKYFRIGLWNSKKHPGNASFLFEAFGKRYSFPISMPCLEAMIRELQRVASNQRP